MNPPITDSEQSRIAEESFKSAYGTPTPSEVRLALEKANRLYAKHVMGLPVPPFTVDVCNHD